MPAFHNNNNIVLVLEFLESKTNISLRVALSSSLQQILNRQEHLKRAKSMFYIYILACNQQNRLLNRQKMKHSQSEAKIPKCKPKIKFTVFF